MGLDDGAELGDFVGNILTDGLFVSPNSVGRAEGERDGKPVGGQEGGSVISFNLYINCHSPELEEYDMKKVEL